MIAQLLSHSGLKPQGAGSNPNDEIELPVKNNIVVIPYHRGGRVFILVLG